MRERGGGGGGDLSLTLPIPCHRPAPAPFLFLALWATSIAKYYEMLQNFLNFSRFPPPWESCPLFSRLPCPSRPHSPRHPPPVPLCIRYDWLKASLMLIGRCLFYLMLRRLRRVLYVTITAFRMTLCNMTVYIHNLNLTW